MSSTVKSLLLLGAVLLVLLLGWTLYFLFTTDHSEESEFTDHVQDRDHRVYQSKSFIEERSAPQFQDATEVLRVATEKIDLNELLLSCSDPTGELSSECREAMDEYFQTASLGDIRRNWITFPGQRTYGQIFEDPESDREQVLAALERPECQLEKGEFRPDLHETCAAEAFGNLYWIHKQCHQPTWSDLQTDDQTRLQDNIESILDFVSRPELFDLQANYYRQSIDRHFKQVILEGRWRSEQCAEVSSLAKRMREATDLVLRARQFGDYAAILDLKPGYTRDEKHTDYLYKKYPWAEAFDQYVTYRYTNNVMVSNLTNQSITKEKLRLAINLVQQLNQHNISYDITRLVGDVCTFFPNRLVDADLRDLSTIGISRELAPLKSKNLCADAIQALNTDKEFIDFQRGQVLDKFEKTAYKLGVLN